MPLWLRTDATSVAVAPGSQATRTPSRGSESSVSERSVIETESAGPRPPPDWGIGRIPRGTWADPGPGPDGGRTAGVATVGSQRRYSPQYWQKSESSGFSRWQAGQTLTGPRRAAARTRPSASAPAPAWAWAATSRADDIARSPASSGRPPAPR